jgi:hypothetical protein
MLSKPNFFLDTSVCIDVARAKAISANDWSRTWGQCKAKLRYCISPVTAYELVAGLAESNEAHFIESREAISVLYPTGPKRFLDQLSVFVPNTVFGEARKPADSVDTNFDLWMKAILRSPDKATLQSGRLRVGLKGRTGFGLDLESIRKSIRDIQAGYARLFHSFRKSGVPDLTPDIWAKMVLKSLGKPFNSPNVTAVLERLDAAYQFDRYLWQFIRNPDYDFSKHRGEIVDAQQLYYLCQSNIYLVTNDARLKRAVSGSPQGRRVLTYQDLTEWLRS